MFKRLVEYLSHSSIHGLHYIMDEKRHISERMFWAIICFACLLGACLVLKGNIYNYENNAVSFVMETTYLKWNTTFPAISICEFESSEKINDIATKLYGRERNMNLDFYLREIAFYNGHCYTCSAHCGKTINCSQDFDDIVRTIRYPCRELLGKCKFNGVPFKCCRYFHMLTTEKGPCYTINSMHLKKPDKMPLDMTSNKNTGPGKLEFMASENVNIFLHAPEDIPYLNHPLQEKEAVPWGSIFSMRFKVSEIENDPYVKQVSISQRNCRFPSENYLRSYKLHSYSACVVDCRARNQIKYCNCTHHFMPKIDGVRTCDLAGLNCLSDNQDKLKTLRTADYIGKVGLVCECMSSCVEPEYTVISKTIHQNNDMNQITGDYGTKITIVLDALPKEQFKRKVVRTTLDLVVSMGGTIGFFLGASLLSITELFYFFCVRKMVPKNKLNKQLKDGESYHKIASMIIKKSKRTIAARKKKNIPFSN